MAAGEGPRAAPVLADVPAYAGTPLAGELELESYVGVPIEGEDGVMGTICGVDRARRGSELADLLPLLELCAGLVGRLWQAEHEARTDPLTQLPNRRGWEEALVREEERCRRFGHPAAIVAIDLDDFKQVNDLFGHAGGDEHLRRTARALAGSVRDHDVVARWGGDEFYVLAVECDEEAARALCRRIGDELRGVGVAASVAFGRRLPAGLTGAAREALAAMETEKKRRQSVADLG